MYDVIVKKYAFAISSPDEFLVKVLCGILSWLSVVFSVHVKHSYQIIPWIHKAVPFADPCEIRSHYANLLRQLSRLDPSVSPTDRTHFSFIQRGAVKTQTDPSSNLGVSASTGRCCATCNSTLFVTKYELMSCVTRSATSVCAITRATREHVQPTFERLRMKESHKDFSSKQRSQIVYMQFLTQIWLHFWHFEEL